VFPRAAPLEKDQTVLVVVRVALTIAVAPCRIVRTVDEPGRFGFAYSTLPGHPEEGEEAFLIETDDTGTVAFNVEAISRPAALVAKLGAPVSRMVQRRTATRYLEGLAHYVNAHS